MPGPPTAKTRHTYGAYAGTTSSVADGERLAMALALEREETHMPCDSAAAIQTLLNLSQGTPPRSGIEQCIKVALRNREASYTAVLWVRSHIGISGNEKADKRAEYESILGDISGATQIATAEGVRAISQAARKDARTKAGFGQRRSE